MTGNEFVQFRLHNGIVEGRFIKRTYLDKRKALEIARLYKHITQGRKFPLLLDVRKAIGINKYGRDFLARNSTLDDLNSCALLNDSLITKFLCKFFIQINQPEIPMETFGNRISALIWLKQFKPQNFYTSISGMK